MKKKFKNYSSSVRNVLIVPHGQYQLSCFYENCGVCLFLYMRGRADFEFCLGTARLRRFSSFCRRRCSNKTILYYSTWFGFGFSICFFGFFEFDYSRKRRKLNTSPCNSNTSETKQGI